jgi:deoxyadenosine/deoxycytidine kinase
METGISPEYLGLLHSFYDEWLGAFDLCPVLTIQTDDLDFVNQPGHLDTVVQRIQEKLTGREVMDLTRK